MRPIRLACVLLLAFAFEASAGTLFPFVFISNGLAPPNPANVIDADNSLPNNSLFVRPLGCGPIDTDDCHYGAPPTFVSIEAGGEIGGDLLVNDTADNDNSPAFYSRVMMNGGRIGGDVSGTNGGDFFAGEWVFDMAGGEVIGSVGFNYSAARIGGGTVGGNIGVGHLSHFLMTGGTVLGSVGGEGPIQLLGGSILGDLRPAGAFSTLEWHGGTVGGTLIIGDALRTTIFGSDFAIDGVPVPYGQTPALTGLITGTLENGDALSTQLRRNDDYVSSRLIFAVPEPAAGLLIGVGLVALAASRRRR